METKDEWIPYSKIDFNDFQNNVFSIDTRDFFAGYRYEPNPHKDLSKLKKCPDFFFTDKEVMTLLDRYYKESGGEGRWRMFSLKNLPSNWDFKYIRIWRTDFGFIICDRHNRAYKKGVLENSVNTKHLNLIKQLNRK